MKNWCITCGHAFEGERDLVCNLCRVSVGSLTAESKKRIRGYTGYVREMERLQAEDKECRAEIARLTDDLNTRRKRLKSTRRWLQRWYYETKLPPNPCTINQLELHLHLYHHVELGAAGRVCNYIQIGVDYHRDLHAGKRWFGSDDDDRCLEPYEECKPHDHGGDLSVVARGKIYGPSA